MPAATRTRVSRDAGHTSIIQVLPERRSGTGSVPAWAATATATAAATRTTTATTRTTATATRRAILGFVHAQRATAH